MKKPYIGITGFTTKKEVEEICDEFNNILISTDNKHIPMLGFLVSYKTLNKTPVKNKRYPLFENVFSLLRSIDKRFLTMIHYNSREINTLADQVSRVFEGIYENGLCRAMQLNIVWPDLNQVKKIKTKFPEMQIVFQASQNVMKGKTPIEIAKGIKQYNDFLDYVLIDPSGGRGEPFNIKNSLEVYSELREKLPDLTIGFAGGFTEKNVSERLLKIILQTGEKDFCIDAEGGLRDKITKEYGDDLLNIDKSKKYSKEAYFMLS